MSKYVVSRLEKEIDPESRSAYDNLIQKSKAPPILTQDEVIEFGATLSGVPIGIVRVALDSLMSSAEINSIYVEENHRKQGVATQMLVALMEELKKEKYIVLIYDYPTGDVTTSDLEDILKKLKWYPPRTSSVFCKFDATIFNPPWLEKVPPLPEGFREFPWNELSEVDRHKLMNQEKQEIFSQEVTPFGANQKDIEHLNSIGLRYKGEVVGWMVTHRKAPDTIQYSCFYIQKRWQMSGVAVKLLSDSIKLQLRSDVKWATLQVNVEKTEPSWLRFLEKRLIPYAQEVYYTKRAWVGFE